MIVVNKIIKLGKHPGLTVVRILVLSSGKMATVLGSALLSDPAGRKLIELQMFNPVSVSPQGIALTAYIDAKCGGVTSKVLFKLFTYKGAQYADIKNCTTACSLMQIYDKMKLLPVDIVYTILELDTDEDDDPTVPDDMNGKGNKQEVIMVSQIVIQIQ